MARQLFEISWKHGIITATLIESLLRGYLQELTTDLNVREIMNGELEDVVDTVEK